MVYNPRSLVLCVQYYLESRRVYDERDGGAAAAGTAVGGEGSTAALPTVRRDPFAPGNRGASAARTPPGTPGGTAAAARTPTAVGAQ